MKRKNKETGEIADFEIYKIVRLSDDGNPVYEPFKGDIAEWDDYKESEEYWFINGLGKVEIAPSGWRRDERDRRKSIGNYFETKEEAKKAVEKLKAWKRLKDKGAKIKESYSWKPDAKCIQGGDAVVKINLPSGFSVNMRDLDLLFGGEE